MTEAGRRWFWRVGNGVVCLLLVTVALWLVLAGHVLATCPGTDDWPGWATLSLVALPILLPIVLLPAGAGLLARRDTVAGVGAAIWVVFTWMLRGRLGLAVTVGVGEHMVGVRSRYSMGFCSSSSGR